MKAVLATEIVVPEWASVLEDIQQENCCKGAQKSAATLFHILSITNLAIVSESKLVQNNSSAIVTATRMPSVAFVISLLFSAFMC